jgi:hypothetical protein
MLASSLAAGNEREAPIKEVKPIQAKLKGGKDMVRIS